MIEHLWICWTVELSLDIIDFQKIGPVAIPYFCLMLTYYLVVDSMYKWSLNKLCTIIAVSGKTRALIINSPKIGQY